MQNLRNFIIIFCICLQSWFAIAQNSTTTLPGFIGLNSRSPVSFLTIEGNEQASTYWDKRFFIRLNNKSNHSSSVVVMEMKAGTGSGATLLGHHAPTYYFPGIDQYADFGQLYSTGAGLILRAGSGSNPSGIIKFMTGVSNYAGVGLERMRIAGNGNVGIGAFGDLNYDPTSKLHIHEGDVYLDDSTKGIILKSPNGSCWRVTVDDWGNLNRTNITCPY